MAVKEAVVLFLALFISLVVCENNVPVLIWTDKTSESATLDSHTTSLRDFSQNYVENLVKDKSENVVIFLQDKLRLEDFMESADIFNEKGHGGELSNLKVFIETHKSVTLPGVQSAAKALMSLKEHFHVHHLHAPYDVNELHLKARTNNLLITHLPSRPQSSLEKIDDILGSVMASLKNKLASYTALYTAKDSSTKSDTLTYTGRHLLAASTEKPDNATFLNVSSCIFLYSTNITLGVHDISKKKTEYYQLPMTDDSAGSSCKTNSSMGQLVVNYKNLPEGLSKFGMLITFKTAGSKISGDWMVRKFNISWATKAAGQDDVMMDVTRLYAPRGWSYHCSEPKWRMQVSDANGTSQVRISLYMGDLQLQYDDIKDNKFGRAYDCVGFFTIPILEGLFASFLLIFITTFGYLMLNSVKTMDRFDDPKGKTITVNVNE